MKITKIRGRFVRKGEKTNLKMLNVVTIREYVPRNDALSLASSAKFFNFQSSL